MGEESARSEQAELDPEEFLRRMLAISPEDAAKVREDAAKRDRVPEDAAAHAGDQEGAEGY